MDLGPDPTDRDDIIQRYARRLFVLAYHLTGDAIEAEELSQECLVRSLLGPDFPSSDREAGVYLHRGLISLWRERTEQTGRGAGLRVAGGAAGAGAGGGPREHPGLWRALSRLDPVSRAVLVLRVAEGHEYETIGKVLDMAPDVVYARLLQARSVLQAGERALEASLFETMNLYLDGRLPGEQRGQFERRLQTDATLRDRVEFHRGLTLELHEEAPPLPREFTGRLRERLDRAQETLALVDRAAQEAGWEPAAQPGRSGARAPEGLRWWRWAAAVAGALVIGVALGQWAARRRPLAPPSGAGSGPVGSTANPEKTPDEATIEALRSLGYLAPAKERPKKKTDKPAPVAKTPAPTKSPMSARPAGSGPTKPSVTPAPRALKPAPGEPAAKTPASPPAIGQSAPGPSPSPPGASATASPSSSPFPSASPTPSETPAGGSSPPPAAPASPSPGVAESTRAEAATTSVPPRADAVREETPVAWRVIAVAKFLAAGRNQQVIRTPQEWAALFDGTGAPPPEVAFDREMAVLLRDDPAGDPAVRFVVAAVTRTTEALLIECHREQPAPGSVATAGQAVVMPISDLPIRLVVR